MTIETEYAHSIEEPEKLATLRIPLVGKQIPEQTTDVLQKLLQEPRLRVTFEAYATRKRRLSIRPFGVCNFERPEFLLVEVSYIFYTPRYIFYKPGHHPDEDGFWRARKTVEGILDSADFYSGVCLTALIRPTKYWLDRSPEVVFHPR